MSDPREEAARELRTEREQRVAAIDEEFAAKADAQGLPEMAAWFRESAEAFRDPLRKLRAIGARLDRKKAG